MKLIDSDKLKERVTRLIASARENDWPIAEDYLRRVIDIIDSLQQEQPEVDFEKEVDACWQNWLSPSNKKEVEGVLPKTEFAMYARHFYELGRNARKEK